MRNMSASARRTRNRETVRGRVFTDFARPRFREIKILHAQNQKLRAARDLLLPRLMSGAIAV